MADRFTPLRRLGHTVRVFWTRTGEVIDTLPVGVDWDYSDGVTWSALGSLSVTVPVLGQRNPVGRRVADQLRLIARAGSSLSLALVRDDDRRVMAAGYVTGVSGTTDCKITCASLGKLLDSRILIENPYWGTPNDERADLSFTLETRDLILELFRQGSTGYRRNLPIDIPAGANKQAAATEYKAEDLVTVYEAVKKQTERDDGPEVALTPILSDDGTGAEWVRWQVEAADGNGLLGSANLFRPDAAELPPMPTWNWPHDVDLEPDLDYSEMVSTGYVPGDSVGTTDRTRIIGVTVVDRGGDYLPALERADRTNVSSTNVTELNAQARSYVETHSYPTHDWAISVPGDRWPLLGRTWAKGDLCRIRVAEDRHWLVAGGEYVRRITAVKHSSKEALTLTTSDASELGLPVWTP